VPHGIGCGMINIDVKYSGSIDAPLEQEAERDSVVIVRHEPNMHGIVSTGGARMHAFVWRCSNSIHCLWMYS
jgi:hypothetical protein